jgi:WD40 repeat protein
MTVKVWDTASGKKLSGKDPALFETRTTTREIGDQGEARDARGGLIWALAVSPGGKYVASSGVRIWDVATGKVVRSLETEAMSVSVAYSPDGKYLAGSAGQVVVLWDGLSGAVVRKFPQFPDWILKVAFSPDGRLLFAASNSSVKTWELPSGEEKLRFRLTSSDTPTEGGVISPGRVAFSPDGRRFAIALLGTGTVAVWDVTRGQPILSLPIPGSQVLSVAFSPDGHWLAAAGLDGAKGIVRVWDARPLEGK